MPQVKVDSIDALRAFKVAIIKFIESANAAMGDAESDGSRTLNWLENEQRSYWQSQIRKRHDMVEKCKEAVRMKKLYKDSSGKPQSAVEEEKALRLAQQRFAEAEQKAMNVKRSIPRLQKEIQMYAGGVQRFAGTVQQELPAAASKLEDLVRHLEEYVGFGPTESGSTAAPPPEQETGTTPTAPGESMARPEPAQPQEKPDGTH